MCLDNGVHNMRLVLRESPVLSSFCCTEFSDNPSDNLAITKCFKNVLRRLRDPFRHRSPVWRQPLQAAVNGRMTAMTKEGCKQQITRGPVTTTSHNEQLQTLPTPKRAAAVPVEAAAAAAAAAPAKRLEKGIAEPRK